MGSLGFVSVEDLAKEISKHHDSDLLRAQLAELRAKKIDLKKFCSNVRMMVGAKVLLDTVKGLQTKQRDKMNMPNDAPGTVKQESQLPLPLPVGAAAIAAPKPEAAAIATPAPVLAATGKVPSTMVSQPPTPRSLAMPPPTGLAPSSSFGFKLEGSAGALVVNKCTSSQQSASTSSKETKPLIGSAGLQNESKTLVHALLCGRKECSLEGCLKTKELLTRVKDHAGRSNLRGRLLSLADSSSLSNADNSPLRNFQALADTALESSASALSKSSASALSNAVSMCIWELCSG